MRRTILSLLVLGMLARIADGSETEVPNTVSRFDFGPCWSGTVVRHEFTFTNAGSSPWLVLGQTSTCSCSVAERLPHDVAPGSQLTVPIVFSLPNAAGTASHGRVTIHVIDGSGSKRDLSCEFTAQPEVAMVLPGNGHLTFPSIDARGPELRHREIIIRGRHPAAWDRLQAKVVSGSDVLAVEVGPSAEHPGDWNLDMVITPGRISGVVMAGVELSCWNGSVALPTAERMTITMVFLGGVFADPSSVLIGALGPGEEHDFEFTLHYRDRPDPVSITKLTMSDAHQCSARVSDGGVIMARFIADHKLGRASGWIDVETDQGPLRVPYYAAIASTDAANGR